MKFFTRRPNLFEIIFTNHPSTLPSPRSLGGSAWQAAATSFSLFTIGAIVPVIPFVVLSGTTAIVVSILASSVMLFAIGAVITVFTGRPVLSTGIRQIV